MLNFLKGLVLLFFLTQYILARVATLSSYKVEILGLAQILAQLSQFFLAVKLQVHAM